MTASPVWLAAPVAAMAAAAPSPAGLLLLLSSQALLLLLARSFLLSFAGRPCFFEAPVAAPPTLHEMLSSSSLYMLCFIDVRRCDYSLLYFITCE